MADALSINIASISIVLTQCGSNVVVKYIIIGSYQMTITVVERLQTNILAVDGLNQLFAFETSKKRIKKKTKNNCFSFLKRAGVLKVCQSYSTAITPGQNYIAAAAVTDFCEFLKQI